MLGSAVGAPIGTTSVVHPGSGHAIANDRPEAMVHIVDDDPAMREALSRLLSASGYAVGSYASAASFLATAVPSTGMHCLLLDLELQGMNGLELQQAIRERGVEMPIVFISAYGDVPRAVEAIKGGAVDFLLKPLRAETLLPVVECALAAPRPNAGRAPADHLPVELTEREAFVLKGIVAGRLNKQLAYDLNLSERTIKSCRAELMRKFGVRTLAELIRASAPSLVN